MGKYEEALERAKKAVKEGMVSQSFVDEIFGVQESEDERIREEIIGYLTHRAEVTGFTNEEGDCKRWIAYLEKQKEQKPVNFYVPEGIDMNDPKSKIAVILGIYSEQTGMPQEEYLSLLKFLGEQHPANSEEPKEWSEDFEENIRNLLHDKLTWHSEDGSMSSAVFIDDKTLKDIVNGIWFYVGKEALKYPNKELSQPEWSEEDKHRLEQAINALGRNGYYVLVDWLQFLPERFNPQPKQEWSEDDEWKRNELLKYLEEKGDYRSTWYSWLKSIRPVKQEWSEEDEDMLKSIIATCQLAAQDRDSVPARHLLEMQERFLKSLRPQQKQEWSEEDEMAIKSLINYFESKTEEEINSAKKTVEWLKSLPERFNLQPKQEWSEEDIDKMVNARARKSGTTKSEMEFYRQGIKDTLKSSLRPLPHWKPSEEQMEALMRTITWLVEKGNLTDSSTLADLRCNLQKLM